jgi:hypothetical protein
MWEGSTAPCCYRNTQEPLPTQLTVLEQDRQETLTLNACDEIWVFGIWRSIFTDALCREKWRALSLIIPKWARHQSTHQQLLGGSGDMGSLPLGAAILQ